MQIRCGQIYSYKPRKYTWYYIIYGAYIENNKFLYVGMAYRDRIPEGFEDIFQSYLNRHALFSKLDSFSNTCKRFALSKSAISKMTFVRYDKRIYNILSKVPDFDIYREILEKSYEFMKSGFSIGTIFCSLRSENILLTVDTDKNNIYYIHLPDKTMSEKQIREYLYDYMASSDNYIYKMSKEHINRSVTHFYRYRAVDIKLDVLKYKLSGLFDNRIRFFEV